MCGVASAGGVNLTQYHLTFDDEFKDLSSLTNSTTYVPGKKWYTNSVVCCGVRLGYLSSKPSPFIAIAGGGLTIRAQILAAVGRRERSPPCRKGTAIRRMGLRNISVISK